MIRLIDACAILAMASALLTPETHALDPAPLDGDPVVFVIGQSNAAGWDAPLTGRSLQPAARLIRGGYEQAAMPAHSTGIEDGLIDALVSRGLSPVVVVEATGGISLADWIYYDLPDLDETAARYELEPDMIVLVHGETDGRTPQGAERYLAAAFGPDSGSLVSLLRQRWPDARLVVTEARAPHLAKMRHAQREGCASVDGCFFITTSHLSLQRDGLHYDSAGYYWLGLAVAELAP